MGITRLQDILGKSSWPVTHLKSLCLKHQIFKTGKKPCLTSPPIPRHLPKKLMNRRQLGKGRTEHNRLDVTVSNTAGKSGNRTRQSAETLSGNAWPQKLSTINVNKMKKENGNVESTTPSGHLLHATSTPSSWK
jgi:hypothetical protein